nr:MAG TPA: hypothetical protein [Caudoviricetes sp.]
MANTYFHGYMTIPDADGVKYLLPTTTVNDVIADTSGKTLNTVINEINESIKSGDSVAAITNSEIDKAFTDAGLK